MSKSWSKCSVRNSVSERGVWRCGDVRRRAALLLQLKVKVTRWFTVGIRAGSQFASAAWSEREWNAVHTMAAQRGARTMAAHWTRS